MSGIVIRQETPGDADAVFAVEQRAFGQPDEARLVQALWRDVDVVLALVAENEGMVVGHVLFSRLFVERDGIREPAVALAPLAVDPDLQRQGVGSRLVVEAHRRLAEGGETLSLVVGDPAYYGRFGYSAERAVGFESAYAGPYLQALDFGGAPASGRLVYAPAFDAL